MRSEALDPEVAEAIEELNAALDKLLGAGVAPVDARDAVTMVQELEGVRRRVDAANSQLLDNIDTRGLHRADGHGSAKIMVRHLGRLPNGEALAREKAMKACRDLPTIAAAWQAGEIGTAQVQRLGRVHANPRVRDAMPDRENTWLDQARELSFQHFEREVTQWERLTDQDGPQPDDADRTHEDRDVKLIENPFDFSWELTGTFGSLQGASMREILDHYVDAETRADWDAARAEFGDAACASDLSRTDKQRRADALARIFADAAASDGSAVPPGWVHNVEWSVEAFEEMLRRSCGHQPEPFDPDTYRCHTRDGRPVDPNEAIACALVSKVRRVIVNAASEVIDQGRARCFTGAGRNAVLHGHTECLWPGCGLPVTRCQADHVRSHGTGGHTQPNNGVPLCPRHNRLKETGYTITRKPDGTWHVLRPDGTPLPP